MNQKKYVLCRFKRYLKVIDCCEQMITELMYYTILWGSFPEICSYCIFFKNKKLLLTYFVPHIQLLLLIPKVLLNINKHYILTSCTCSQLFKLKTKSSKIICSKSIDGVFTNRWWKLEIKLSDWLAGGRLKGDAMSSLSYRIAGDREKSRLFRYYKIVGKERCLKNKRLLF